MGSVLARNVRRWFGILLVLTGFFGSTSVVQADPIAIKFTARVSGVAEFCQCIADIQVGSLLVGHYVYDSNAPDQDPRPNWGVYRYSTAPHGFVAWVGQHEFKSNPNDVDFSIILHDSVVDFYGLHDSYGFRENNVVASPLWPMHFFLLFLRDNTATAISGDSLPSEAPSLDDWPTRRQVQISGDGFDVWADILFMSEGTITGIPTGERAQSPALALLPNLPNPFSAWTLLRFELPSPSDVAIEIYDITGRRVFSTRLDNRPEGLGAYVFDGRDQDGVELSSGVYFYRLEAAGISQTRKLLIVR